MRWSVAWRLAMIGSLALVPTAVGASVAPAADGRQYEMISPPDKNDNDVSDGTVFTVTHQAALDGNAIAYVATGGFGDAQSSILQGYYLGTRADPAGWLTHSLNPPLEPFPAQRPLVLFANSADLHKSVVGSQAALAPGAVAGAGNLYLRDNDAGTYELMATSNDPTFRGLANGNFGSPVYGGTSGFERVVFSTPPGVTAGLTPDAVTGGPPNTYEWDGSRLRLVNYNDDATVDPLGGFPGRADGLARSPHIMSADGSRIFFTRARDDAILMRQGGRSVLISASHRRGDDPSVPADAWFRMASRDGTKVFLTSHFKLTDDSTAANGAHELYRYNTETGELLDLSVDTNPSDPDGAHVNEVLAASDEGDYVYFAAQGNLAAGGVSGGFNIYVWHNGTVRHITTLNGALDSQFAQNQTASPNGKYLAFRTFTAPPGYDNISSACPSAPGVPGPCALVQVYDATKDQLVCVSCRPDGRKGLGNAAVGGQIIGGAAVVSGYFARGALDDGRVFFDSPDPLVSADTNGRYDVYEVADGTLQLISPGDRGDDAHFIDAGASGRDVFFATRQQLVGVDRDRYSDLYDARIGGGMAAQNPLLPPTPCQGPDCRAIGPVLTMPKAASTEIRGHGNLHEQPAAPSRIRLLKKQIRGSRVTLVIRVPERGRLRIAGRWLQSQVRLAKGRATLTLRLRLSSQGSSRLAHRGRLKIRAAVRFTTTDGGPSALVVSGTLKAER